MKLSKTIYKTLSVFCLVAACSVFICGQQADASYNVSLNLVIGSNDGASKGELPAELAAVSKQIRSSFQFSNYRVANTLIGRISNNGTFQYQSVANISEKEPLPASPTFLDWSLVNLKSMPNAKGQMGFQAQTFRFGARVPVVTGSHQENGKTTDSVNYESIGLSLQRLGITENMPTVVGTLTLPGTSGTIFLIMTVKSAD